MTFPRLTRAQVREIDRRATADYGIPGIVLMENAARSVVDVAMIELGRIVPKRSGPGRVEIYCGGGNNGGDGLAIARHLHNRSVQVRIRPAWRKPPAGDAAINWAIVQKINLPVSPLAAPEPCDLIIDALFGTGLDRPVTGPAAEAIEAINQSGRYVLAVDVPSGLDCDTGRPLGPCIRAKRTVTFVAAKPGFDNPTAKPYTGDISIGDIGIPPELVESIAPPSILPDHTPRRASPKTE